MALVLWNEPGFADIIENCCLLLLVWKSFCLIFIYLSDLSLFHLFFTVLW